MAKGREAKPHIGIYGRRNNGKSSFINTLAGQDIAIVSEIPGTTTDPVKKSFEITGFGPVVLIDTAGIDDIGNLGEKRVNKTLQSIQNIDLALLIIAENEFDDPEKNLIKAFKKADVPYFIIHNKSDIQRIKPNLRQVIENKYNCKITEFNSLNGENKDEIIDLIKLTIPESSFITPSLIGDLLSYGDIVLLITPIDAEAPAGRLILPQVQAIRDILDNDCVAIVLKEREVDIFLKNTGIRPKLVITDSQIFVKADASIPKDIPLTSFSIMLARYKGDFQHYLEGTPKISELLDNDQVLILESCTHHVSCDDIGRVKIPRWISNFTGKKLAFDIISGLDPIPKDINEYSLVIQCGGCMITRKQLHNRLKPAIDAGIPVSNYGMTIAYVQGIYERAIAPFVRMKEISHNYL
ncbi:[FeFe] hydrogenase H-cluster maturation GTPase HydF [Bacteroidota bacterium]